MAALTDYLEDELLNLVLNGIAVTPALSGTVYVGAFSGAVSDALTSGGAAEGEIAGNGYARVAVVSGFIILSGTGTNDATVQWPVATGSWGTISGVALFDDPVSGNALAQGTLGTPKAIDTSDVLRFTSGSLALTFN